ncbi:hypothetical protein N0V83_005176 [Neocucurbitaria cava]|uniref:Uncharacterized protein n=1 Tax=Neocucurbitaria cava TaxID=798079 RepID=A0A9W8Y929_9PLEO|nr:hypothetical protein N0V83_005176 [Neocucurbitaria cava]
MPLMEKPPVPTFDSTSAPPPYTPGLAQLPTPTPTPQMNAFAPPMQPGGFPQGHIQPQVQQQQQFQPGQFIQSPQGQPQYVQNPTMQQQMPMAQQPYQAVPNMTSQQVQQVQQVLQNMPPEKLQMVQQQVQQAMPPQQMTSPQPPQGMAMSPPPMLQQQSPPVGQPQAQRPHFTTTAPSGLFGKSKPTSGHGTPSGPQDAQKSDGVKRFFGDTLVGRVARSSVQTATSMAKMPTALSPWGDNNPVTLPNVRYRDAVLFTTFAFVGGPLVDGMADGVAGAFGADSFISEIVSSGAGAIAASTVIKYGVFQIVEQAIDKGIIEHMLPEEEKMLQTTNVKSLQVGIRHKLMGVDADLRFVGIYPARNTQACEKGWFCPYLFASARTPSVPRAHDFAIAQSFGPFLGGDYLLAHKLLAESAHTLSLCSPDPTVDIGANRMLVLFTAISPFRANMWSTSRRPGCGTIVFHLFDGCPALVLPVTKQAPITAWSPWTLSQMRMAQYAAVPSTPGSGMYSPEWQHEQICEYLDTIISLPHVNPSLQDRFVDVLGRSVSLVINGALALDKCQPLLGKIDPERAGVIMLRF